MSRVVEKNKSLVAFLMVDADLVSQIVKDLAESPEVNVLHFYNVTLFGTKTIDTISYIYGISYHLGKVHVAIEAWLFATLVILRIRDDHPDKLLRLEEWN